MIAMRYAGVLFDLFGTLVAPYRTREHQGIMRICADQLGISFEDCYRFSGETYPRRMRGEFASMADNLDEIARLAGRRVTRECLSQAERVFEQFTRESLDPVAGALELLEWLTGQGLRLGLVSNCAPDVPRVWSQLEFARYFEFCAFSCQMGSVKPEPAIYHSALKALGLRPEETLYVGDGSDDELSGAAACGLQPVLVTVDLSNTYDSRRSDVDEWSGRVIRGLPDLRALIEEIDRDPAPGPTRRLQ